MPSAYRAPGEVRRTGNRLRDEASRYLRQHAANPVDWYPWGAAALQRARDEDLPIFLSSGYASCHWCHVMEREVFEHDSVAEILNRHFVAIKVDREELPAVDAAYLEAVQLLTGGGGWPMSVFLTPDRQPFFGGTYFPRDRFLAILARIRDLWATRRADVASQAGEIAQQLLVEPAVDGDPQASVAREALARHVSGARARFDERAGGFAGAMKFPVPIRWRFLLDWYRSTGDADALAMVVRTLEAMAAGGLRDHVGGGFHRYTVDPAWTVPHFEKMLYDNAQLASLFLAAGAALGRADFTAVGVDTLDFLAREMSGADGVCYASLDADSGGEEGSYYVWTRAQLVAAVGPADGPPLADLLGVTAEGNFERRASVVTRRADHAAVAARHGLAPASLADLFDRHRDRLRSVRAERTPPGLDRKVVTAWNALALSAFVHGFMATGHQRYRDQAERIAAYVWRVHRDDVGRLRRASNDGRAVGDGILEDHGLLAQGLLNLFQASGDAAHLERARILLQTIRDHFRRPAGGWYATADWSESPLGRRADLFDSVTPGGASATVDALVAFGTVTGQSEPLAEARAEVARHAGLLERAGLEMAGWLAAALRLASPLRAAVIAGDPRDPDRGKLLAAAWSALSPATVVVPLPADGAASELLALAPLVAGKRAESGRATAFVCLEGTCLAPSADPAQLGVLLNDGRVG
ncbi:MAG TPA: thioredoxin domain-containing protein [Candidatus Krumholzibacteria bacterium]|nr:thioredoxin domain-containing protein [Candidatus Krumholzibacteria bacterium]HPD70728.1 thioredoxin domain-containing protein [Candidatus Krumholzibacteria bacterium]HRY39572.1 thioredoxin domain-containing protein [Candidatus Krumholzibacteria bacterium]